MTASTQNALFLSPGSGNISNIILNPEKPHQQASIRLQAIPAAQALRNLGIASIGKGLYIDNTQEINNLGQPILCFVCKLISPPEKQPGVASANLAAIEKLNLTQRTCISLSHNQVRLLIQLRL